MFRSGVPLGGHLTSFCYAPPDTNVIKIRLHKEQGSYRWLRGSNMPSVDNLYALSRYLNGQVDDVIVEQAA